MLLFLCALGSVLACEPRIIRATLANDVAGVRQEIDAGADLEVTNACDSTPLIIASMKGFFEIVQALCRAGAKLDAKNEVGYTPLIRAAGNGCTKVVRFLLEAGADLEDSDNRGTTALQWACHNGKITTAMLLLDYGAQINALDHNAYSALMIAANQGHLQMIKLLLARGANNVQHNSHGSTAQFLATVNIHHKIVTLLEKFDDFLRRPEKHLHLGISATQLRQFLIWSIAHKRDAAYETIKALRRDWFAREVILLKLFLLAARVGNLYALRDIFKVLQQKPQSSKILQVFLNALFFVSRTKNAEEILYQCCAEKIALLNT